MYYSQRALKEDIFFIIFNAILYIHESFYVYKYDHWSVRELLNTTCLKQKIKKKSQTCFVKKWGNYTDVVNVYEGESITLLKVNDFIMYVLFTMITNQ